MFSKRVLAAEVLTGSKTIRWFLVGRARVQEEQICLGCKAGTSPQAAELRFSSKSNDPESPLQLLLIPDAVDIANKQLPEEEPQLSH